MEQILLLQRIQRIWEIIEAWIEVILKILFAEFVFLELK